MVASLTGLRDDFGSTYGLRLKTFSRMNLAHAKSERECCCRGRTDSAERENTTTMRGKKLVKETIFNENTVVTENVDCDFNNKLIIYMGDSMCFK